MQEVYTRSDGYMWVDEEEDSGGEIASSSEAEKQRVHDDELWAESWDASSQQKVQTAEKVKVSGRSRIL